MKLYIGEDVLSEGKLGENDMAHHGLCWRMLCYGLIVFILSSLCLVQWNSVSFVMKYIGTQITFHCLGCSKLLVLVEI